MNVIKFSKKCQTLPCKILSHFLFKNIDIKCRFIYNLCIKGDIFLLKSIITNLSFNKNLIQKAGLSTATHICIKFLCDILT